MVFSRSILSEIEHSVTLLKPRWELSGPSPSQWSMLPRWLLYSQWRYRIPLIMWSCLGMCSISLVCASFVTRLILAQGVCFGIGGGGLYALIVVYASTTFIQALAYFPVSLYMSVYTTSLGLPPRNGTIVLAVFNLATVFGMSAIRILLFVRETDTRAPYSYVIIASGVGASLSAYLLWGFVHNLGVILVFVIAFGTLSGGFSSVWPAASTEIVGLDHQTTAPNVFGVLGISKGIAAVIGPVIAAALHHPQESAVRTAYSGYGFRDVTLFVGSMMLATAAGGASSKFLSRR
ncbi:unnamed protein product [Rhizoctonia solani]|uniref:Major facilitator superfamily (MFS) profile domain-containing protein n=1 Tax=Rhizoctonia solani TaxID=456999 RepID=A0A8H3DB99_9AGAM|nr:unnamed protein product [Rhizoctonia solani]